MKPPTIHSSQASNARLRPIEGKHNALVKELRRAFAHSDLTPDGYCAIEGIRIVEEAIRSSLKFGAVFFNHAAEAMAERLLPQIGSRVDTLLLPDKLFADAVPSESPQGVAALVRCKEFSLADLLGRVQNGPLLAVAGVQDPVIWERFSARQEKRSAPLEPFWARAPSAPTIQKVIRASWQARHVHRLPTVRAKLPEANAEMRQQGIRLIATSSHKGTSLPEARLAGPLAVFIGSEGAGLPRDLMAQMDELVAIPHSPNVESLNAGVAASIVLYEAARQRT